MTATIPRPRIALPASAWLRALPATMLPSNSGAAITGVSRRDEERLAMELIDLEVLRQLEADTSPELMPRMVDLFCDEAGKRVAKVRACADARDFAGIAAEAHTLKSGAGTFGARELESLAKVLEQASRAGDYEVALARADEIEKVARASLDLLREYAVLDG